MKLMVGAAIARSLEGQQWKYNGSLDDWCKVCNVWSQAVLSPFNNHVGCKGSWQGGCRSEYMVWVAWEFVYKWHGDDRVWLEFVVTFVEMWKEWGMVWRRGDGSRAECGVGGKVEWSRMAWRCRDWLRWGGEGRCKVGRSTWPHATDCFRPVRWYHLQIHLPSLLFQPGSLVSGGVWPASGPGGTVQDWGFQSRNGVST